MNGFYVILIQMLENFFQQYLNKFFIALFTLKKHQREVQCHKIYFSAVFVVLDKLINNELIDIFFSIWEIFFDEPFQKQNRWII